MCSLLNSIFLVLMVIFHVSYGEVINCQKNVDAECSCKSTISGEICTLNCNSTNKQCWNDILRCRDNDDCIINCEKARGCQGAQLICPANANCILHCKPGVQAVCDRLSINITNLLSYQCTGDCPIVATQPSPITQIPTSMPTISPTLRLEIPPISTLLTTLGLQTQNTEKPTNYGDGSVNEQTTQSFEYENVNTIVSDNNSKITMTMILVCGVFGFVVCAMILFHLFGCFYCKPVVKEQHNRQRTEHIASNSSTDTAQTQTQCTVGSTESSQRPQVNVSQIIQSAQNDEEVLPSDEEDAATNGHRHKLSEEAEIVFYKMQSEGGENYHKLQGKNSIDEKCNVIIQISQINNDEAVGGQVTPFGDDSMLQQIMEEGNNGNVGAGFLHQAMDDIIIYEDDEMVKTPNNDNGITNYADISKGRNYHE